MSKNVEMTLGISLVLSDIIQAILYQVKDVDGNKTVVERELPFRLKYRLNKNSLILSKDRELFEKKRLMLLAQYGEPDESGDNVVIATEENMAKFKADLGAFLEGTVSHTVTGLDPYDIDKVKDADIPVSSDAMKLFIKYLTEDGDLEKELEIEAHINLKTPSVPKTETPVVEEKAKEETPEPKKTTAKKSTSSKKSSTAKKTTTSKKSTKAKETAE